ncbi:uncharacterized protein [Eucyclogobius newberryi]|uniref:uncharacterized protein n=1 Tax=Eucyclogobius newberryi TaxID=166745 RepID=UPI003B590E69
MLFRTEQRQNVVEELNITNAAKVNRVLGQRWKMLSEQEQAPYYEQAHREKIAHQAMYPGWSARDNFGKKVKRRKAYNISVPPSYHHFAFPVAPADYQPMMMWPHTAVPMDQAQDPSYQGYYQSPVQVPQYQAVPHHAPANQALSNQAYYNQSPFQVPQYQAVPHQTPANQALNNQALHNQALDKQALDNQALDNQSLNNQSINIQALNNQALNNQALNNQDTSIYNPVNQAFYNHSSVQVQPIQSISNQAPDNQALNNQALNNQDTSIYNPVNQVFHNHSPVQVHPIQSISNQALDNQVLTNKTCDDDLAPNNLDPIQELSGELFTINFQDLYNTLDNQVTI